MKKTTFVLTLLFVLMLLTSFSYASSVTRFPIYTGELETRRYYTIRDTCVDYSRALGFENSGSPREPEPQPPEVQKDLCTEAIMDLCYEAMGAGLGNGFGCPENLRSHLEKFRDFDIYFNSPDHIRNTETPGEPELNIIQITGDYGYIQIDAPNTVVEIKGQNNVISINSNEDQNISDELLDDIKEVLSMSIGIFDDPNMYISFNAEYPISHHLEFLDKLEFMRKVYNEIIDQ